MGRFSCAASTSQQTQAGDYAYGYLWHLFPAAGGGLIEVPLDSYVAAGQGGQLLIVVPEIELVLVMTSSNFAPRPPHVLLAYVKYILPAAMNQ